MKDPYFTLILGGNLKLKRILSIRSNFKLRRADSFLEL